MNDDRASGHVGSSDSLAMSKFGFFGASDEMLVAIGKVAVAASHVESVVRDIAFALNIEPKLMAGEISKQIRKRLDGQPLPEAASGTADAITSWLDRVSDALLERHRLMHGVVHMQKGTDGLVTSLHHIKSMTRGPLDVDTVLDVAKRLVHLRNEGSDLECSLLPQPRPGIFVRRPRNRHEGFVTIHQLEDGTWPERPTEAEQDEWWSRYSPTWGPPPAWLIDDHSGSVG